MRVSLEEELLLNADGKDCEDCHGLRSESFLDEGILVIPAGKSIELLCLLARQELVDLGDQFGELRDKLYDSFRNERYTKVVASVSADCYGISDLVSDLGERLLLGCDFLTDQADVGLCLQWRNWRRARYYRSLRCRSW